MGHSPPISWVWYATFTKRRPRQPFENPRERRAPPDSLQRFGTILTPLISLSVLPINSPATVVADRSPRRIADFISSFFGQMGNFNEQPSSDVGSVRSDKKDNFNMLFHPRLSNVRGASTCPPLRDNLSAVGRIADPEPD